MSQFFLPVSETLSQVIPCLVMVAAGTHAHTLNKRSAVHAVPVVSTPAIATAGYAVGASGAIGGQAPATIAAATPVVAYSGALPAVAHHSAVAIATHAIPAAHHSVPIVPLTHATLASSAGHPHGFSYAFSSLSPPLTYYNTLLPQTDIAPPADEIDAADAVDLRTGGAERKKRDAGYLGYHGGYLGGYLGYHGGHVLGLKSAPCVNVNNVPVPCAAGTLFHHGHLGYLG